MNHVVRTEIGIGSILLVAIVFAVIIVQKNAHMDAYDADQASVQNAKPDLAKKSPTDEHDDVYAMISDYYGSIIGRLNGHVPHDKSLDRQYITENVITDITDLNKVYPQGIPYSPFLCAQDYPDDIKSLTIRTITLNDSQGQLGARLFEGWPEIEIHVVKEQEMWKIDQIICPQS